MIKNCGWLPIGRKLGQKAFIVFGSLSLKTKHNLRSVHTRSAPATGSSSIAIGKWKLKNFQLYCGCRWRRSSVKPSSYSIRIRTSFAKILRCKLKIVYFLFRKEKVNILKLFLFANVYLPLNSSICMSQLKTVFTILMENMQFVCGVISDCVYLIDSGWRCGAVWTFH